jgi:hypothetical protein
MDDVANLKQVLVQTQVVERLQETERRQGAREQQQVARVLVDRAEIQGRQVGESPRPDPVDDALEGEPQGGREAPDAAPERRDDPDAAEVPAAVPESDDKQPGASLDVRA